MGGSAGAGGEENNRKNSCVHVSNVVPGLARDVRMPDEAEAELVVNRLEAIFAPAQTSSQFVVAHPNALRIT